METELIKGTLERVKFASDDGEFAVAHVKPSGAGASVLIVGNLMACKVGESVEIRGQWRDNPKFGHQFAIQHIKSVAPTTLAGIERYLASGLINGIGEVLAERIVKHFGPETLEIIDAEPARIREVNGIGKKRAEAIEAAWGEQRLVRNVMVFLQSHGVTPAFAARIWKKYGVGSVETIHQNPYRLAEEIHGIGFLTADSIAQSIGIASDSQARIQAGLLHVLGEASSHGHVFLPLDQLTQRTADLLQLDPTLTTSGVESLRQSGKLYIEQGELTAVFNTKSWRAETDVATRLKDLIRTPRRLQLRSVAHRTLLVEQSLDIKLAEQQRQAINATFENKVSVITGGPGTGKTTIIRVITTLADQLKLRIALAAPTGRAAKRLAEATGQTATTIHRLLEFNPHEGGFRYNQDQPLDIDLLIVDESSMIDMFLMRWLLDALPSTTALLLVGDIDQLPSVGPGNILSDIISSGAVAVIRLNEVFRQADTSSIITNAHRINRGEMPIDPERKNGLVDFYTIAAKSPKHAADQLVELTANRIRSAFGLDPFDDVQVLCPMRRGEVGVTNLNARLQAALNPDGRQYKRGDTLWREGDKVMQIRNNYDREVFNGDIGRIERIDDHKKRVHVRIEGRLICYEFNDLDELRHAYAITIHKSQGSEYRAVVVPMLTQHYMMLQRNLLYTAVTRARDLVVLVGSQRAVKLAVDNNTANHRYTRLGERLKS